MKRFIYIPFKLYSGEISDEALKLASASSLSIRIGEEDDGIDLETLDIISIPEVVKCDAPQSCESGYIFQIDLTNEFIAFDSSTVLRVTYEDHEELFKPKLREKHIAKFRPRLIKPGIAKYNIEVNSEIIHSGELEIK